MDLFTFQDKKVSRGEAHLSISRQIQNQQQQQRHQRVVLQREPSLKSFLSNIMDDDENLSMLLAMGFPDIGEIKKALRMAKNDINEAVAILTNEQPLGGNEIDMHDMTIGPSNQNLNLNVQEDGFPTTYLYELEQRVFQVRAKTL